ncbi:TIGR00270 family protein, partial [archaeon]
GSPIYGKAKKVLIDGVPMLVCQACANLSSTEIVEKKTTEGRRVYQRRRLIKKVGEKKTFWNDDLTLIDNYGERIRMAREEMGMTLEELSRKSGLKVSYLRNIENQRMKPTLGESRILEHILDIAILTKTPEYGDKQRTKVRRDGLTLSDILRMK